MLLRTMLDRNMPTMGGEVRLSPGARDFAYRGPYMTRGDIVECEATPNKSHKSKDRFPYRHVIIRETRGGMRSRYGDQPFDNSYPYTSDVPEVIEELKKPEALVRVAHIEKMARRLKLCASLAVAAVIAIAGSEYVVNHHSSAPTPGIEQCANVVDGSQPLLPLETGVNKARGLGQTVCMVGPYLFTTLNQ